MSRRSPALAFVIEATLTLSEHPFAALATNDAEAVILQKIAFDVTPDQRLQLRWLIQYAVLADFLDGPRKKARARIGIEKANFPQHDFPPTTMQSAWDGNSGVGKLAKAIASVLTAIEKAKLAEPLLPFVPPE